MYNQICTSKLQVAFRIISQKHQTHDGSQEQNRISAVELKMNTFSGRFYQEDIQNHPEKDFIEFVFKL